MTIGFDNLNAKILSSTFECAIPGQCEYETSTSMPSVSSLAISGDSYSIVFTGSNFLALPYTAKVTYADISADTVTVDSSEQVTATWTLGVPVSSTTSKPTLVFEGPNDSHWAS